MPVVIAVRTPLDVFGYAQPGMDSQCDRDEEGNVWESCTWMIRIGHRTFASSSAFIGVLCGMERDCLQSLALPAVDHSLH